MANQNDDLLISAGLDLDDWEKGIRDMVADERRIERVLDGVVDSANDAEKALNDIEGSINLDVDTSDLDKAKNIAEALDGIDPSFDISVDESELDAVRRLIEDIDSDAPTVNISVDETELDAADRLVKDIDNENPNVDVDVDDDDVKNLLEQIRNLQTVDIVMNVTGNVLGVIESLSNLPGIGTILDLEEATARYAAATGHAGDEFETLYNLLRGRGVTASIEQIEEAAIAAEQLGINVNRADEATIAAFNTISVTGGEVTETLVQMNSLINAGLADDFQEASDIIATGFQTGANTGQDFMDVLLEYGSTFERLGFDGVSALNLINSGLEAGFGNADRVADAVREMDIRTREAGAAFALIDEIPSPNTAAWEEWYGTLSDAGKALADLDLVDETEAFLNGELSGEDYFNTVVESLNEIDDAATRAAATVAIFGGQAEDIGTESILALSTEGLDAEDIAGTAQEAADELTNTIGGAITELQSMIDELARNFFSSDELDLDGKLEILKTQIQTFVDEMNSGATFGEGLSLALETPGLEDTIEDLESAAGNIALALATVFASVLDALGQGDAAASIRASVAEMAEEQLIFDIQVANDGAAITDAISLAVGRGVDPSIIGSALDIAFDEALASGELDTAQLIVDSMNLSGAMSEELSAAILSGHSNMVQMIAEEFNISFDEAAGLVESGAARQMAVTAGIELDTTGFEAELDGALVEAQAALEQALWSGDVSGAAALAENMGSSLVDQFTAMVARGDFSLAAIIAAGSPESGLDISYAADQAGYSDEAIANMEANAQLVVDAANATAESAGIAADETEAALEGSAEITETYAGETGDALSTAGGHFVGLADTTVAQLGRINSEIDTTISSIGELVAAAEGAASISVDVVEGSGGAGGEGEHALGGRDSGTFIAGEAGREIVTTDTAMAILNNQTTDSILSGLAMLFSGGFGGGSSSETNITQNNYFNNSGAAASNASLDNTAKGIRGY